MGKPKDRTGIIDLDLHPRFKSSFKPIPVPRSFEVAAEVFGFEPADSTVPRFFTFSRRKVSTEIGLVHGGLWINLTCIEDLPPMIFKEARVWAENYAAEHGFIFREKKRWDD
jgi:hypothetical protein